MKLLLLCLDRYLFSVVSIGGSRGGHEGRTPPLGVQILSISCSFRENLACSRPPGGFTPPLGKILDLPLVSGNRYLPRGSKEKVLSITITGNIIMSRYAVLAVAILFLDFVMIH